jgi:hypothetical protein
VTKKAFVEEYHNYVLDQVNNDCNEKVPDMIAND